MSTSLPALSIHQPNFLDDYTRVLGMQRLMQTNQQQTLELQDDAKLRSLFFAGADHPEWSVDDWMQNGQRLGLGISGMTKLSTWATAHATNLAKMGQEQHALFTSISDKTQGFLQDVLDAPPEEKLEAQQKAKADAMTLVTSTKGLDPNIRTAFLKTLSQIPDDQYVGDDAVAMKMGEHNFHNTVLARQEQASKTAEASGKAAQAQQEAANLAAKSDPNSPLYAPTPEALQLEAAQGNQGAASILLGETKQAGAKAGAEAAAKYPYELKLKQEEVGQNPAFAYNPQTGQRELTTIGEAKSKGWQFAKVGQPDIEKETSLNSQMNDMQLNTSRYRAALNAMGNLSQKDRDAMTRILSDKAIGGYLTNELTLGAMMDQISQGEKGKAWNDLSSDKQDALIGYLRMKNTGLLAQKVLTGMGRASKEALDIELSNMPSPIEGATVGNKKLDAWQDNLDQINSRAVKLPWQETPADVRARVEGQATSQFNQRQSQQPQGKYRANNPVRVGQTIQIKNVPGLSTVKKVYSDGSFDADQR